MYKFRYNNPHTKQYQTEYALYEAVSKLFAGVSCKSLTLDQLKLYHAELSDIRKEEIAKKMQYLVKTRVEGKVCFPSMHICKAEVKIRNMADGTHCFTFTDGVYSFSVSLVAPRKGVRMQIKVTGRKITGLKPSGKKATVNARRCA